MRGGMEVKNEGGLEETTNLGALGENECLLN